MVRKSEYLFLLISTMLYEIGCENNIPLETNDDASVLAKIGEVGEHHVHNHSRIAALSNGTKSISPYPFVVAIAVRNRNATNLYPVNYRNTTCSGSIIDRLRVITSCSCFHGNDYPPQVFRRMNEYIVVAGISSVGEEVDMLKVERMDPHPMCDIRDEFGFWIANVAIVQVAKPGFVFSSKVQPMKYPHFENIEKSSEVLERMSDSRMKCLVLGWNRETPVMQKEVAELIPLEHYINPSCDPLAISPKRTRVDGFMIRFPNNSIRITTGAPLLCNDTVWSVTNTMKLCPSNVFPVSSTFELLFAINNFESPQLKTVTAKQSLMAALSTAASFCSNVFSILCLSFYILTIV